MRGSASMRSSFLPKPSDVVKVTVPASRLRIPTGATALGTAPLAGVEYESAAVMSAPRTSSTAAGQDTVTWPAYIRLESWHSQRWPDRRPRGGQPHPLGY